MNDKDVHVYVWWCMDDTKKCTKTKASAEREGGVRVLDGWLTYFTNILWDWTTPIVERVKVHFFRSGLGSCACSTSEIQLCYDPSFDVGSSMAVFKVVHLSIVKWGCERSIVIHDRCLAGDKCAILFCKRSTETECVTFSVRSRYKTTLADALTATEATTAAWMQNGSSDATG